MNFWSYHAFCKPVIWLKRQFTKESFFKKVFSQVVILSTCHSVNLSFWEKGILSKRALSTKHFWKRHFFNKAFCKPNIYQQLLCQPIILVISPSSHFVNQQPKHISHTSIAYKMLHMQLAQATPNPLVLLPKVKCPYMFSIHNWPKAGSWCTNFPSEQWGHQCRKTTVLCCHRWTSFKYVLELWSLDVSKQE
jgi:hypothetical protein